MCKVLFVLMLVYALFGMPLLMYFKHRHGVYETFNFKTFPKSMILLFQTNTSAGWNDVLLVIMDETDCVEAAIDGDGGAEGDCGKKGIALEYILSYLIISFWVIVNTSIAIILEFHSEATREFDGGLTDDDYHIFHEVWQQFDPEGSRFLKYADMTSLTCLRNRCEYRSLTNTS